jgi:trimeric autotransporter adhesin
LHLIPLLLACFALLPSVQATPDPGAVGGGNSNAADGFGALNATVSGINNSGFGANALHNLTTGNNNAAQGNSALNSNANGNKNTALGVLALRLNISGNDNVAVGYKALLSNNSASPNVAVGSQALQSNTFGGFNTATGTQALFLNVDGEDNTAVGNVALALNTHGNSNTAVGSAALISSTGSGNIAVGSGAGGNVLGGSNNIDIGSAGADTANTIHIGNAEHTATFIQGIFGAVVAGPSAVAINGAGKLGTVASSKRFKDEIKPMDKASEAILALMPVTFRYKQELDPSGIPQFGLVAEDVEKVNPDLVVRDAKGEVYSVRYEAVNAMLLNEFLKEHRKNEEQEKTIAELKSGMTALAATVKEQAAQIQKVSAQLEVGKTAPQVVGNNR